MTERVSKIDATLLTAIRRVVTPGTVIHTLGPNPKPNVVHDLSSEGLLVSTEKSAAAGQPPQEVPAWMVQAAWDRLRTYGELTNRYLLYDMGVRRSSFVCALLARLPDVTVKPDPPITLLVSPPDPEGPSR